MTLHSHLGAIQRINEHKRVIEDDDDFDEETKKMLFESLKRIRKNLQKK